MTMIPGEGEVFWAPAGLPVIAPDGSLKSLNNDGVYDMVPVEGVVLTAWTMEKEKEK